MSNERYCGEVHDFFGPNIVHNPLYRGQIGKIAFVYLGDPGDGLCLTQVHYTVHLVAAFG